MQFEYKITIYKESDWNALTDSEKEAVKLESSEVKVFADDIVEQMQEGKTQMLKETHRNLFEA